MRSSITRPRAAALAFAVLLAACGNKAAPAPTPAVIPTRTVTVEPVGTGAVVDAVELTGELQGVEEVRVFAQVPERIRKLAVKEGQRVKAGDLLATVWSELQTEGVNQAEAALEAALANRDVTNENLARMRSLAQAGSIPKSQLEAAEAQARGAEAQVRQASAAVGSASAQRSRTVVSAPISGVVSQVLLREGDYASPGLPLMTIVRSDKVKGVLRVPERDFLRVQAGMKVALSPLARPDQVSEGVVSLKGPVVDRLTRTGLVEVNLDNADGRLLAGSSIRARIEISRRDGAVLVPAQAILFTTDTERTGAAIAFIRDGKLARRREVRVGARQGDQLEIVSGLKAGEQLVVQGAHFLRDENPIRTAGASAGAEAAR